eukprot:COSAG04_NODE_17216_length_475_cov_3.742021_1_plen_43_part_10
MGACRTQSPRMGSLLLYVAPASAATRSPRMRALLLAALCRGAP